MFNLLLADSHPIFTVMLAGALFLALAAVFVWWWWRR